MNMNCDDVCAEVHKYIDAELDTASHLEIDRHLSACAACAAFYDEQQALDLMLKKQAHYFRESPQLRARIEASLPPDKHAARATRLPHPNWWSFAAGVSLTVVLTWGWNVHQRAADLQEDFREDAISVHLRSLMEGHLVDVRATEPAQLESWFSRRLPYPVHVSDLSALGYSLVGGRLEYLYTQPLAAIVYRRGEHLVNVLTWPVSKSDEFPSLMRADGPVSVMFFKVGKNNFCVISDLTPDEFNRFTRVLRGI
jgi:anti-sigma factor RsiW